MSFEDSLYLSARLNNQNEEIELTIETYICLFVYIYCELDLNVYFVDDVADYQTRISSKFISDIKYVYLERNEANELNLILPSIHGDQKSFFISGLCAVLRWAIKDKIAKSPNHFSHSLLGFRGGCLVACTESSMWTKFCELQLPSSVYEVASSNKCVNEIVKIPESLALLEAHFNRPVRTHNILKRKLDIAKKVQSINEKKVSQKTITPDSSAPSNVDANFTLRDSNNHPVQSEDLAQNLKNLVITEKTTEFDLNHNYLEGIDLTLADMVVFPCIQYFLENLPASIVHILENVLKWYNRMLSNEQIKEAVEKCGMTPKSIDNSFKSVDSHNNVIPKIDQDSLYKRDPSHTKMRIKHHNPREMLLLLKECSIHPNYAAVRSTQLNWQELPTELHPATGDLPLKRIERKCQQIESMVTTVLQIALEGQTIVDFCAGGGHVGLLLAYYLPKCKIILVENKESSMQRAISRAKSLKLNNILFYQCNMDYFKSPFDMGVSLHACGVATDLVIQQCIKQKASFVCSPCCYGSIQNTHLLNYPLSSVFRTTKLPYKKYTVLAHCADRTEVNTPTADQGELCMGLIDTDRVYFAQEHDYAVELSTLYPKSCSPKHNLLIGISPKWNKF